MMDLAQPVYRYTDCMYQIAEHINQEVIAPLEIKDDIFIDFLADNHDRGGVKSRIAKPYKRTLLHSFITNLTNAAHEEVFEVAEVECKNLRALVTQAGLLAPSWINEDDIHDHIDDLDKLCRKAVDLITPTVFHLLFSDRNLLFRFQQRIAVHSSAHQENAPGSTGRIARCRVPGWLRKAVFYRDQGRCQLCFSDLTGLISPAVNVHLDHMVPLASGGSNDPTNFQLACKKCNTSKGSKLKAEPARFMPYW
ncbi:HNH endonuclease [Rhodospirillum rubrum]|uniref:HNH endonuclease n=1 Tax=Rhodospirillum rubrum TaxID=1085 RepID=UPI0011D1B4C4|nr:HNH endonuclease [Rhodospirillum rubrum]QXG81957.1 HNH endonuclease [Rhodospirillum rubrum]